MRSCEFLFFFLILFRGEISNLAVDNVARNPVAFSATPSLYRASRECNGTFRHREFTALYGGRAINRTVRVTSARVASSRVASRRRFLLHVFFISGYRRAAICYDESSWATNWRWPLTYLTSRREHETAVRHVVKRNGLAPRKTGTRTAPLPPRR